MKNEYTKQLIPIGKVAKMLGVTVDTLRRWDKTGYLKSIRITPTGNRYYQQNSLESMLTDVFSLAKQWILSTSPMDLEKKYYCPDSYVFQSRLHRLESELMIQPGLEQNYSLITQIVGEIGNNAFDHNIGSWPDVRGLLFAYDLKNKKIALADRGRGILETLKQAKPELGSDEEALLTAFTEKLSGRAPENRGNGLKLVKLVVTSRSEDIPMKLYFQSGQAALNMHRGDVDLTIFTANNNFRGCLALINF